MDEVYSQKEMVHQLYLQSKSGGIITERQCNVEWLSVFELFWFFVATVLARGGGKNGIVEVSMSDETGIGIGRGVIAGVIAGAIGIGDRGGLWAFTETEELIKFSEDEAGFWDQMMFIQ